MNLRLSRNQKKALCILLLLVFGMFEVFAQGNFQVPQQIGNAHDLDADRRLGVLNATYTKMQSAKDSAAMISNLLDIASIYGNQAKFKESYDYLWKALLLAEQSRNLPAQATINVRIGRHYGYYKRKSKALEYYEKSLEIKRKIIAETKADKYILIESYHAFCSLYREYDDVKMMEKYLDSCYLYYDEKKNKLKKEMLEMERAVILTGLQRYEEAEKIFDNSFVSMNEKLPHYLVLFEYYQGVNYYKMGKLKKAILKLNHALWVANKFKNHYDYIPNIYKTLSDAYLTMGDYPKSYDLLNQMHEASFMFFDSRSDRNRPLLEIQDEYRIYREKQWQDMQALKLKELENSKKILFLQRTILVGGILVILLVVSVYIKSLTKRYKFEKEQIRKKQELEIQKANELIELKNRELAASTLKLIQKDEIVDDFKNSMQTNNWNADPKLLKSFIRSWELNYDRNWEEFEKRFVDINKNFYEKLREKFPILSTSDSRLCALIKLQFSSKEIAQLMGITNESVHTTRSRLRKKLDLPRDINLTEFMAQF